MTRLRIGQGFDVHRFCEGRPLMLCGHHIEGETGLGGHSDADVALHAVADAILGAVARGDIGDYFPAAGARWQGAASAEFVAGALEQAAAGGFRLVNCDLTIVGERPRIAPHRSVLRTSLATLLGLAVDEVSVKATTTEGLGPLGRGEGLGALAVVLMEGTDDDE
jgi:2-C-methyl-D-erythritol 4-phosphate cytidylyltransferase/2-C-methyl-D-erythritol 2,4-cyclodiphosphate synthase